MSFPLTSYPISELLPCEWRCQWPTRRGECLSNPIRLVSDLVLCRTVVEQCAIFSLYITTVEGFVVTFAAMHFMLTCIHLYAYTLINTCTHSHTCLFSSTNTHVHIHTHTHTQTQTRAQNSMFVLNDCYTHTQFNIHTHTLTTHTQHTHIYLLLFSIQLSAMSYLRPP